MSCSSVKVDLDVKPPREWLSLWVESRVELINWFGLDVRKINFVETDKGYHFWFILDREIDFDGVMLLQFLLGDDPARVWFGLQRRGFKRFRRFFNILFNYKLRLGDRVG